MQGRHDNRRSTAGAAAVMLHRGGSMGAMLFSCTAQRRRKPLHRQYQYQQQGQLER